MSAVHKLEVYAAKAREVQHWALLYAAELDQCAPDCDGSRCDVGWFASKLWTAEQDMLAAREDTFPHLVGDSR